MDLDTAPLTSPHIEDSDHCMDIDTDNNTSNDKLDKVIFSEMVKKWDCDPKKVLHSTAMLTLVTRVAKQLGLPVEMRDIDFAQNLLEKKGYKEAVQNCWRFKNFQAIREWPEYAQENKQKKSGEILKLDQEQVQATIKSWDHQYLGDASACLFETIKLIVQASHSSDTFLPKFYAPILSIIQSSGTGKSRMVDELSKKSIVIPVNLRGLMGETDTGFPPADIAARDFLLVQNDTKPVARFHAYLRALFEATYDELKPLKESIQREGTLSDKEVEEIASKFRALMNDGQSFSQHNAFRIRFYDKVVNNAKTLMDERTCDIKSAATKLSSLINSAELSDQPAVTLSFDEAHALAKLKSDTDDPLFKHLRGILNGISDSPIFSIFVSTISQISDFTPPIQLDRSARISSQELAVPPPFTALGFDQFAEGLEENSRTIGNVSTIDYMVKFGRPLFFLRYNAGSNEIKRDIVKFALTKLCGHTQLPKDDRNVEFACLSVRIPLQFMGTTSAARQREQDLVANHLRICLNVDEMMENIITTAPSEPILAEAARMRMSQEGYNLPEKLLSQFASSGLDKGDRGELIALAILILASDKSRANSQLGLSKARKLSEFFSALFPSVHFQSIKGQQPSKSRQNEDQPFEMTFEKSEIYFNHFIKLHDYKVVNRRYLWGLIARGAAILCANNQRGFDIIIPFVFSGSLLGHKNTSAILIQVKNDGSYQANPHPHTFLFDAMNPFTCGIFDPEEIEPKPIIRMVFALAADESAVKVVNDEGKRRTERRKKTGDSYTAFDIWCAKCSEQTFNVIPAKDEHIYQDLLKLSRHSQTAYLSFWKLDTESELRKRMNPGTAADPIHWQQFIAPVKGQ